MSIEIIEIIKFIEQSTIIDNASKQYLMNDAINRSFKNYEYISNIIAEIDLVLKYYDLISIKNKQLLFSFILSERQIIENDKMHELIKKLLIDCDVTEYNDYGTPLNQMLSQKSFIFDMFYEKYNNILDMVNTSNYGFYNTSIFASTKLLQYIFDKIENVDLDRLLKNKNLKQKTIAFIKEYKEKQQIKKYDTLLKQYNELMEQHNNLIEKHTTMENKFNKMIILFKNEIN